MKILIFALSFCFSLSAVADCQRQKDGSCYNDDYISNEKSIESLPNAEPFHAPMGIAVGEPAPDGSTSFPRKPRFKRKRNPSGFVPVRAGVGKTPGFIQIKDMEVPLSNSPGSK